MKRKRGVELMKKSKALMIVLAVLMLVTAAVNAAEEKVGIDYAQYNLADNLLLGF